MNYRMSEELFTYLKEINENILRLIVDTRTTNYKLEQLLTKLDPKTYAPVIDERGFEVLE